MAQGKGNTAADAGLVAAAAHGTAAAAPGALHAARAGEQGGPSAAAAATGTNHSPFQDAAAPAGNEVTPVRDTAGEVQRSPSPPGVPVCCVHPEGSYKVLSCELTGAKLWRRVKQREYFVITSLGTQHYTTEAVRSKGAPRWESKHNLIVQEGGADTIRFAVFRHAIVSGIHKRLAVGVAELQLGDAAVGPKGFAFCGALPLFKPTPPSPQRSAQGCAGGGVAGGSAVGELSVKLTPGTVSSLEKSVWSRVMALGDLDHDGSLSRDDFVDLMTELGCTLPVPRLQALFAEADTGSSGTVCEEQLSALLASYHVKGQLTHLMTRCFVCGADLSAVGDDSALVHVSLCMDEGTGQSLQGAFSSEEDKRLVLALKLSEWTPKPPPVKRSASSKLAAVPRTAYRVTSTTVKTVGGGVKTVGAATMGVAGKGARTLRNVANKVTTVGRRSPKSVQGAGDSVSSAGTAATSTTGVLAELENGVESGLEGVAAGVGASMSLSSIVVKDLSMVATRTVSTTVSTGTRLISRQVHPVLYVWNRHTKELEEEVTPAYILMAMRELYMNPFGRSTLRSGGYKVLRDMSARQGRWADSAESAKSITKFIEGYKGQLSVDEIRDPLDSFKTFNQFFNRKLKPSARPIASPNDDEVIISSADCRLNVFDSVSSATRFWIKGRRFSVAGLLGDAKAAEQFEGGSMAIFRLAPQDYHRFHLPVAATIKSIKPIAGQLYTVNPIAIRSKMDVFTQNKRSVVLLNNPVLGDVAYVAIGATVVGGIQFTVEVGDAYPKGQDLGYFSFGGSTCILLFPPNVVTWDSDLLVNSQKSLETLVRMGERIGVKAGSTQMETESTRLCTEAQLHELDDVLLLRMSLLQEDALGSCSANDIELGALSATENPMKRSAGDRSSPPASGDEELAAGLDGESEDREGDDGVDDDEDDDDGVKLGPAALSRLSLTGVPCVPAASPSDSK